jgi:SAM-dependent methyltransferase
MSPNAIKVVTKTDVERIEKELWGGRDITQISYPEFIEKQKLMPQRIPIIEIVNGYGIYAYEFKDGTILFGSFNMKTGIPVIYGIKSLDEIRRDIRRDVIKKIEKIHPRIYSAKSYYDVLVRQYNMEQKYNGRVKRFLSHGEKFVLDLGAGDNPDLRATHAIDLVAPEKHFVGLEYQMGYDLHSSTVELPYPDTYFDRVVSYGGLAINFESLTLYKEIYRILKPGGNLEFNHASKRTKKWLIRAVFQDIRNDEYFDEIANQKIGVIIATKPKMRE